MGRVSNFVRLTAAGLSLCVCAFNAFGADSSNSDVFARLRPEYDPNGMRIGTFSFYPSLTTGAGANGNVFNSQSPVQDQFYSANAQATLQSAWSRHELRIDAQTKSIWFAEQVSENRNDWQLAADLRLDVLRGTSMSFTGNYGAGHEARGLEHAGGLSDEDPSTPTPFQTNGFNADLVHSFNRLKITLGGGWQQFDFQDVDTFGSIIHPVTSINNDDRDRSEIHYFAKTAFEFWSDTSLFARTAVTSTDYLQELDDGGVNRDSQELAIDAGVDFEVSHVLVGELSAGFAQKSFDEIALAQTSGVNANAKLKWYPTMLTNVTFAGGRSFEETTQVGASTMLSTRAGVTIDHELLRNLILSGSVSFENAEFEGTERTDDVLKGGLMSRFMINNHLHLDASWEYLDRSSTDEPFVYSTHQFQFSLTGKL